jgi:pyridoxamine 5'-phosphate oxidase
MTKQEIIDFLKANEAGYLATVENDEPRVRGMAHYITADGRIVYHTGTGKDLAKQVPNGAVVEMCVFEPQSMTQVRVRGAVETLNDQALKEQIVADRPFLKPMVDATGYEHFLLFALVNPKATVWTMADNFAPKEWVQL